MEKLRQFFHNLGQFHISILAGKKSTHNEEKISKTAKRLSNVKALIFILYSYLTTNIVYEKTLYCEMRLPLYPQITD